jgi:hypothetical protein
VHFSHHYFGYSKLWFHERVGEVPAHVISEFFYTFLAREKLKSKLKFLRNK